MAEGVFDSNNEKETKEESVNEEKKNEDIKSTREEKLDLLYNFKEHLLLLHTDLTYVNKYLNQMIKYIEEIEQQTKKNK